MMNFPASSRFKTAPPYRFRASVPYNRYLSMTTSTQRNLRRTVLPNGLIVLTERMDYLRSVAMGVWVAGFAGHMIVWRGERFELRGGKLVGQGSGVRDQGSEKFLG